MEIPAATQNIYTNQLIRFATFEHWLSRKEQRKTKSDQVCYTYTHTALTSYSDKNVLARWKVVSCQRTEILIAWNRVQLELVNLLTNQLLPAVCCSCGGITLHTEKCALAIFIKNNIQNSKRHFHVWLMFNYNHTQVHTHTHTHQQLNAQSSRKSIPSF